VFDGLLDMGEVEAKLVLDGVADLTVLDILDAVEFALGLLVLDLHELPLQIELKLELALDGLDESFPRLRNWVTHILQLLSDLLVSLVDLLHFILSAFAAVHYHLNRFAVDILVNFDVLVGLDRELCNSLLERILFLDERFDVLIVVSRLICFEFLLSCLIAALFVP